MSHSKGIHVRANKCLRNKKTGKVTRVPNYVAVLHVATGDWGYISRSKYREIMQGNKEVTPE